MVVVVVVVVVVDEVVVVGRAWTGLWEPPVTMIVASPTEQSDGLHVVNVSVTPTTLPPTMWGWPLRRGVCS